MKRYRPNVYTNHTPHNRKRLLHPRRGDRVVNYTDITLLKPLVQTQKQTYQLTASTDCEG